MMTTATMPQLVSPNGFAAAAVAHAEAHEARRLAQLKANRTFETLRRQYAADCQPVPTWVYDYCASLAETEAAQ
jgi:hypothetical protein